MGMGTSMAMFGIRISARVLKPGLVVLGMSLGLLQWQAVFADSPAPPTLHSISYPAYYEDSGYQECKPLVSPDAIENLGAAEKFCTQYFFSLPANSGITAGSWTCPHPADELCFLQTYFSNGANYVQIGLQAVCPSEAGGGVYAGGVDSNGNAPFPTWCLIQGEAPPAPVCTPSAGQQVDPVTNQCISPNEQNAGCPCLQPAATTPPPNQDVNDPIDPGFGNLYEEVTDYQGTGAFPLVFKRYYNSAIANQPSPSPDGAEQDMGPGWSTGIGAHINLVVTPVLETCVINGVDYMCPDTTEAEKVAATVWHADGSQAVFTGYYDLFGSPSALTPEVPGTGQLLFTAQGIQYIRNDGYTEYYDSTGKLTSVQDPYGATQTYTYNYSLVNGVNTLTSLAITDVTGRTLTLSYTNGFITQMTDPAGNQYTYGYDTTVGDPGYGNLVSKSYTYTSPEFPVNNGPKEVIYLYENSAYPHALTGILDENESSHPNGPRYSSWTYDAAGRANSSQHAGGQDLTSIQYNPDGSADITEATGVIRHMTFQTVNGRQMLATLDKHCVDCGNDAATVAYDGYGHLQKITDFKGNQTLYQMDPVTGLELSRTEAYGDPSPTPVTRTITTAWCGPASINGENCILPSVAVHTVTEPGRITHYDYLTTASGAITKITKTVTDTATGATRITVDTYDGFGHLTSEDGPRNGIVDNTTYTYYSSPSAGNHNKYDLASITAGGLTTTFSKYDADGKPTVILDANNVERDIMYDTREVVADDSTAVNTSMWHDTEYDYYSNGLLENYTPTNGPFYTYAYDDAHRLISVYDGHLDYKLYAYTLDSAGFHTDEYIYNCNISSNCLNSFPPVPGTGVYQRHRQHIVIYDDAGDDEIQDIGGAGQTTTYVHDVNGNVASLTKPAGSAGISEQIYGYDALNRLQTMQDQNADNTGGTTTYVRDALDHLRDVTSPGGVTTQYSVDAFGETTQVASPDSGTTNYDYSNWVSAGQVVKTDARDMPWTYTYDGLNRLTTATNTSVPAKNMIFTWDNATSGYYGLGRLSEIQDVSGTTTYQYDPDGNVLKKISTVVGHSFTTKYSYRPAGKDLLLAIAYPTLTAGVQYQYDSVQNRVSEVDSYISNSGTVTTTPLVTGITYEPFSEDETGMSYANGLTESRQYDGDYRLTNITVSGGIMNWTYGYNPDGTISGITDGNTSSLSQAFTYDGLDRLTAATQSGGYGAQSYGYLNPATQVDMDGNRAQMVNAGVSTSYLYRGLNDGSGNPASNGLTSDTTGTTTHDFTYNADGDTLTDGSHTHAYDVLDVMNQVKLTSNGSVLGSYNYNGLFQRVEKVVGSTTTLFAYDESGHLIAELNGSGTLLRMHAYLGDRPIAFWPSGGVSTAVDYIHTDQLGTPRFMTSATGALAWYWRSDPFGNGQPTGSITYNLRFPGQYYDAETGLYYNNARYYSPSIGRYYKSDPIGLDGGLNTYTYSDSDPVDEYDPSGTDGLVITPEGVPVPIIGPSSPDTTQLAQALTNASDYVGESFENMDSELVDVLTPAGPQICPMAGHTKGKRPSTKGKHQKGDTRRNNDYGGEKGDQNGSRRPPRNPPPNWQGGWPPKPPQG